MSHAQTDTESATSSSLMERQAQRPGNLAHTLTWRYRLFWAGKYVGSGVLLSLCFSPCEWSWFAWIAMIPAIWMGACQWERRPLLGGYLFGLGHFATTMLWLREIFVLVPLLLGGVLAIYPALWLWLSQSCYRNLLRSSKHDLEPIADPTRPQPRLSCPKALLLAAMISVCWIALEWARGKLLSGMPWNQLGISQWKQTGILPVAAIAGVSGISFIIIAY